MKKMVLVWAVTFSAISGHSDFSILRIHAKHLASQLGKRCFDDWQNGCFVWYFGILVLQCCNKSFKFVIFKMELFITVGGNVVYRCCCRIIDGDIALERIRNIYYITHQRGIFPGVVG